MNIRLRKLEPTDLPFLYQWENDASAWADADNHNPLSQQDLRAYIESTTGDIYRDGQLRLMIESAEEEALGRGGLLHSVETLGCIDLFDLDIRNRKAAIGMYIAPSVRGKGIGEQAVIELEKYASSILHLRMIYAIISVHNKPCTHLYENLGYHPSSPLLDWTLEGDAVIWQKHFD